MTDLQNDRNGFGCRMSALDEFLSELPVRYEVRAAIAATSESGWISDWRL